MSELQVDESTAAYVRSQARRAGISESAWLAQHFRDVALRESAAAHANWYDGRPGVLEDEVLHAQTAYDETDAA